MNYALLVGSRPRTKGMERKDLLEVNGAIFTVQGKALAANAADDVRILVVGNPANTNCLIAMNNAGSIPRERFTAMTRLDHNRAMAQLAAKRGVPVASVTRHDDLGQPLGHAVSRPVPRRGRRARTRRRWSTRRGSRRTSSRPCSSAAPPVIEARGSSWAASAANAAIDHVRDWVLGRRRRLGEHGGVLRRLLRRARGLMSGFPCTTANGACSIVPGLEIDEFSRARIDASVAELGEERDTVAELGLI